MERIRKTHNSIKRELITSHVSGGTNVLDLGCGRGGDLHKWKTVGANVFMIDPCEASVNDAKKRQKSLGTRYQFKVGDVLSAPRKEYDVVCSNFSIQYVFKNRNYMRRCLNAIVQRLRVGGKFIGCVPDSEFIRMNPRFKDGLGNFFTVNTFNDVGDCVDVMLVDTPYYNGKVIPEPIAHKDIFVTFMENKGLLLTEWEPIMKERSHTISDLYSKFCFVKVR